MREIALYIYNNVDDPVWEMEVCGNCGQKLIEVKGTLYRRVTNSSAPVQVFKAETAVLSELCRRCGTRTNLYITSYDGPKHYAM